MKILGSLLTNFYPISEPNQGFWKRMSIRVGLSAFTILGTAFVFWPRAHSCPPALVVSPSIDPSMCPRFSDRQASICPIAPLSFFNAPHPKPLDLLYAGGWQEKLRANPRCPERSYPIDQAMAQNWIDAHALIDAPKSSREQREMAEAFIDATRHVSHAEFEGALWHSVSQFNRYLENKPSKEYLLVVSEEKKSNRWVAELALKYLDVLPVEVLRAPPHWVSEKTWVDVDYVKKLPAAKHIVFMDDAAYSCSQVKRTVCELGKIDLQAKCGSGVHPQARCSKEERQEMLNAKPTRQISVIVPFMRDPECILMKSDVTTTCHEIPNIDSAINVFTSQKLYTLKELLTPEQYRTFIELYRSGRHLAPGDEARVPCYFDHKIADTLSSFPEIYERGEVAQSVDRFPFIDKIAPPYKS